VRAGAVRDDVGAGAVMMAVHGIGAAHDRPERRAEADGVITLVLDGLRRPNAAN
jgi:Transcriptional regulator SbtR-like, C-terminal domain